MTKYRIIFRYNNASTETQKDFLTPEECKKFFMDLKTKKVIMYAVIQRVKVHTDGTESAIVIGNYYL